MTRKEELYLQELGQLIRRLEQLAERQQQRIEAQEAEIRRLGVLRDDLLSETERLRQQVSHLLTARMIVADDGDWLIARSRLEHLQETIKKAIKSLETEIE